MKLGGLNKSPRFTFRRQNGQVTVDGSLSVFLGYSLASRDGVWTNWDWDGATFDLSTDRYGIYPTYYFKEGQSFGVSTSIPELLKSGASPELDDPALAVFIRLGFFLGEDTPFRQIRALPPGGKMLEYGGTWDIESTGVPDYRDGKPPTRAAALAEFGSRFQAAIDALITDDPNRVCVPLSGGRDSRHILLAMMHRGNRPACCATLKHLPPKSNEDARIAAAVAAALGVRHVVLEPIGDPIEAELKKNALTNFCADEHGWAMGLGKYVRDCGYNVLYDGIGGDVLSDGLFLTQQNLDLYRPGKLTELAELLLGSEGNLAKMLQPEARQRWRRELAVERVVAELARYAEQPNPIGQFFFWNRTRREIALMFWSILGRDAHAFAPFLAAPVFDFLASLPAEYFLDHSFHTEAISLCYPDYSNIPYESKGHAPRRPSWLNLAHWSQDVFRYCVLRSDGDYIRRSFILPRLVKGLIDPRYGARQLDLWSMPLYLEQLSRLERHSAANGSSQGAVTADLSLSAG